MAVLKYSKQRQKWFNLKNHYAEVLEKKGYTHEANTIGTCHQVSHLAGCKYCKTTRYILHKCGHRLCPICSYHVSRDRADFLRKKTAHLAHPKLITLTIPTEGDAYTLAFHKLSSAFKGLRRDKLFKLIKGGAYTIEVIPHETYYHIHMHLLVDAPFIPRQQLFAAWRRLLNIQYASVDVRAATTIKAREYITKYAAKSHAIGTDPDLIWKLYDAIKGRRIYGTFGTWYNVKEEEDPDKVEKGNTPGACPGCGRTDGFFWIRHGGYIYGQEAWREFEPFFLQGRPETETHEIIWEEKDDKTTDQHDRKNATETSAQSKARVPEVAVPYATAR